MSREQIDRILSKWISRKLLVFLIATLYLACKLITSTDWLIIASIYIATETAIKIVTERIRK